MTRRRRVVHGIRDKLILSFSLLVLSISVFVFVFFPARLERQAMRTVIAKAEAIRDMTAFSASSAIVFSDSVAVREVLAGAARERDVLFLVARDANGQTLATRGTVVAAAPVAADSGGGVTRDGRAYVTTAPISFRNNRVGTLTVGMSLDELRENVTNARWLGATVSLVIFAIGLVIVYAISTLVTRPLTDVGETVHQISAGNLSLRAVEPRDAEVAEFVRAFNQMVDNLTRAQQDLAAANLMLEARVRERTAEATATSEMLTSLINVAPEAIIAIDLDWNVTRWNKAAEHLFGWTEEEVLGKPLPHVPPDQVDSFRARQQAVMQGHDTGAVEVVRQRKDGSRVTVLFSAATMFDKDKRPVGHIAVATDLTERKLLEDQLRQSQKMEAIGRLAGGVAHDFNNILTVITSSVGMLLEANRSERERHDLEQIAAATARAAALTRQLLTFSKKHVVHLQPVNLSDIVRQTEPMLRRLLRANIDLITDTGTTSGVVTADPVQIEQVIMNLVVNASDAMPDGGTLTIRTESVDLTAADVRERQFPGAGPFVLLTVTDTGVGMDAATLNRIFEPFFTTKDVGRGTGLGLAIVYAVVSQLGGHVTVDSVVNRGTTFRIYLPRVSAPRPRERALTPALVHAVVPSTNETVLLVEDEDAVRKLVKRTLERFGYRVLDAASGEAALTLSATHEGTIDVVVTDLMMPGMNGRAFADRLILQRPDVRVVFMSGYADETVNREGMVDGTHAFLQKPFTGAQLVKTIQQLLEPQGMIGA